jgi:hypothetical protein
VDTEGVDLGLHLIVIDGLSYLVLPVDSVNLRLALVDEHGAVPFRYRRKRPGYSGSCYLCRHH